MLTCVRRTLSHPSFPLLPRAATACPHMRAVVAPLLTSVPSLIPCPVAAAGSPVAVTTQRVTAAPTSPPTVSARCVVAFTRGHRAVPRGRRSDAAGAYVITIGLISLQGLSADRKGEEMSREPTWTQLAKDAVSEAYMAFVSGDDLALGSALDAASRAVHWADWKRRADHSEDDHKVINLSLMREKRELKRRFGYGTAEPNDTDAA